MDDISEEMIPLGAQVSGSEPHPDPGKPLSSAMLTAAEWSSQVTLRSNQEQVSTSLPQYHLQLSNERMSISWEGNSFTVLTCEMEMVWRAIPHSFLCPASCPGALVLSLSLEPPVHHVRIAFPREVAVPQ